MMKVISGGVLALDPAGYSVDLVDPVQTWSQPDPKITGSRICILYLSQHFINGGSDKCSHTKIIRHRKCAQASNLFS